MATQAELEALFNEATIESTTAPQEVAPVPQEESQEDLKALFEGTEPEFQAPQAPTGLEEIPQGEDPTIQEKLVGAGEAGLSLLTGATGGTVGNIAGALTGAIEQLKAGKFGTHEGARLIEEKAQEFMQALTFQPKGEEGQEYVQEIAKAFEPLTALAPIAAEAGSLTRAVKTGPKSVKKEIPKITPVVEEIAELAAKAGQGNKKAKIKLAEEVKINPQAVDAADRLGINLPSDVLGDSQLVKQTTGLVRSQIGEESAKFIEIIEKAVTKSDEALESLGKTDIATTSGKLLDTLDNWNKTLGRESENIYKNISKKIPKETEVQLVNSLEMIDDVVKELGGRKQLTKQEKSLLNLIESKNVTYEALQRERRQIGQSLGALPTGKYSNSDRGLMGRIYSSLKRDQLDNVESLLGKEARDQLHLADRTFQKKIALEKRIADNFGKDGEGSISSLLTRAMTQGSKGDITALNKVLKVVPKSLQKETVISALSDAIGSKRGIDFGDFDFNSYTKLYNGLRKNAPVYNKIIKTIGVDKHQILNDLFIVSSRLTDAKSKILTTGKANQAILKNLQEEALMQRIIKGTIEKGVSRATFGGVQPSMEGLFKTPKDRIAAMGELIRSEEFKNLATEAINKTPEPSTVKKMANSAKFKNWVIKTGTQIADPEAWIYESLKLQQREGKKDE